MRALIDHEYTDELVCPHCGYEVGDSWELPELGRRACGDCGKEFEYEKNVSTSFTSWKVEEQQEVAAGDLNDGR